MHIPILSYTWKRYSGIVKMSVLVLLLLWIFSGFFGCGGNPVVIAYGACLDGKAWAGPLDFTVVNTGGQNWASCYHETARTETFKSVSLYTRCSRFGQKTTYVSGGPADAIFIGLFYFEREFDKKNSEEFQTLINDKTDFRTYSMATGTAKTTGCGAMRAYDISYGFVFRSARTVNISATLDGKPWAGLVNYSLEEVIDENLDLYHPSIVEEDPVHHYSLARAKEGGSSPRVFDDITGDTVTLTYQSGGPPKATLQSIDNNGLALGAGESGTITMNFNSVKETADIEVNATLNGEPWAGNLDYTIQGPGSPAGNTVPAQIEVATGNYTAAYISGGPEHARLISIIPPGKQSVLPKEKCTFTYDFESSNNLTVRATLDGKPWSGDVNYTIFGKEKLTGNGAPQTYKVRPGIYAVTYLSGGPPDARLEKITPDVSQDLTGTKNAVFTLNFVSTNKIKVNATLDGQPWEGNVYYRILGPTTHDGFAVPSDWKTWWPGDYTLVYTQGGPAHADLKRITPAATQSVEWGGELTFTMEFVSRGSITVTGSMYTGSPWEGACSYEIIGQTVDGPVVISGSHLPYTFYDLPEGTYTLDYISGAPEFYEFHDVIPPSVTIGGDIRHGDLMIRFVLYDPTVALPGADLSVFLMVNDLHPASATNVTYTIAVTNNGPADASGVVVNFHRGLLGYIGTSAGPAYNAATGDWTIGNLPAGASVTITVTLNTGVYTSGTSFTHTAQITVSGAPDKNSTNNAASITIVLF